MRVLLSIALSALAAVAWAVPVSGAAPFVAGERSGQVRRGSTLPQPARFRINRDRGLLVSAWVNGRGPYVFVIDTGAGLNVVSERFVTIAGLKTSQTRQTLVGGRPTEVHRQPHRLRDRAAAGARPRLLHADDLRVQG